MRFILSSRRNPAPPRSVPRNCPTPSLQSQHDCGKVTSVLKKSHSSFHASQFLLAGAVFFMVGLWACHGNGNVYQFNDKKPVATIIATDIMGRTKTNLVWESLNGNGACLWGDVTDWQRTVNAVGNAVFVNTTGAAATPFTLSTNVGHEVKIQFAIIALRTAPVIRARECLLDGRLVVRADSLPINSLLNTDFIEFERDSPCDILLHRVNGVDNDVLKTSQSSIVEVNYGTPQKLREIALGSSFGHLENPKWRWGFGGADPTENDPAGFYEVIFFEQVPSEASLRAIRKYLDHRYTMGLNMPHPSFTDIREAMSETGMNFSNFYSTLLILR